MKRAKPSKIFVPDFPDGVSVGEECVKTTIGEGYQRKHPKPSKSSYRSRHESVKLSSTVSEISDLIDSNEILYENEIFLDLLGENILLVMQEDQLNLFGQTFRPIFCGTIDEVTNGFITLNPVIIKMPNAPYNRFPIPLTFPLERISHFTRFDCSTRISLT
ncbi:hypothetical protein [Bacillus mojavensis]|uniref:hypothetical protein n=1 Tax=Bacillus mojavensis TaxID=72360 RepID=UPI002DB56FEF|nr:hypothetical protein [Bacillus mojavensis]MEC1289036.1 hypothetical protein [Bacillus mojavensis]MEC1613424.1 hypothetical protein [Bacillus mojavensis]MEC1621155.1 hypothetical protein [Bacillus mojavensis]MEC1635613.1 hypothetical protein [Bacillus mojavensis]MEC1660973.1 hypothetical protein [Bacillus mojavensis]